MTPAEYADLVDFIEDRWGRVESWANAGRLTADFALLDADEVFAAVRARVVGDPGRAAWPPKPAELIALTLERMRHKPPTPKPALPDRTEGSPNTWAELSMETYGEIIPISTAIQLRHKELTE